jgi:hypothetical protein
VRIFMSKHSDVVGENEVTLRLDARGDHDTIEAMVNGTCWIACDKGLLVSQDRLRPLPAPAPDPVLALHWTDKRPLLVHRPGKTGESPHIFVESLHGYDGRYTEKAALLEAAGFVCLRSRRGRGGWYWELWMLPYPGAAAGEIAGKDVKAIVSWICRKIVPGNIYVTGTSYGLSID